MASPTPPTPPVDMSWKNMTLQWGTRAPVHKDGGLTLEAINVGVYGEIPDYWEDRTRMPRGSYNPPTLTASPIGGYYLRHKSDLWADNAPALYEEGISRRWSSATQIPWDATRHLRDDVEIAMAQVATELSQQASIAVEVVSSWFEMMSYGYHEVKVYLATANFDHARHFEVFRKRALVNGAGLGLESPGQVNRILLESRAGWTETALLLYILRGLFTRTVYRYLAAHGPTEADRLIGAFCVQDASRHIAYATQHLKYAVNKVRNQAAAFNIGLQQAELIVSRDDSDPVFTEALACALGGGVHHMAAGMKVVAQLRQRYVQDYLRHLDYIGVDRRPTLSPGFKQILEA